MWPFISWQESFLKELMNQKPGTLHYLMGVVAYAQSLDSSDFDGASVEDLQSLSKRLQNLQNQSTMDLMERGKEVVDVALPVFKTKICDEWNYCENKARFRRNKISRLIKDVIGDDTYEAAVKKIFGIEVTGNATLIAFLIMMTLIFKTGLDKLCVCPNY